MTAAQGVGRAHGDDASHLVRGASGRGRHADATQGMADHEDLGETGGGQHVVDHGREVPADVVVDAAAALGAHLGGATVAAQVHVEHIEAGVCEVVHQA